ncbi:hypothetical protein [Vibrio cincinnatiensis]|nr:hypothetical protein [Vibrio cincinnatiensis]
MSQHRSSWLEDGHKRVSNFAKLASSELSGILRPSNLIAKFTHPL